MFHIPTNPKVVEQAILAEAERLGPRGGSDFRWNYRVKLGFSDKDRAEICLRNIAGKRLTYAS